jgi:hypothetical protein
MSHAYVTVETLKGTGVLELDGTTFDAALRRVSEGVANQIDGYVNRVIHPHDATLFYSGDGGTRLIIKSLTNVGTIKEDSNGDGTFDTAWAAADFFLMPYNANPTSRAGSPYTMLEVSPKSNGTQDAFLAGPRRYQIDGTWGFVNVTLTLTPVASADWATGTTKVPASVAGLEPGMVFLVDSERIYVESTAGTTATVQRGVLGSTAGSHGSGAVLHRYVYPAAVQEAAIMQAARLWKRKDSGYASQVGFPEVGMVAAAGAGLDRDVKQLLGPFRRRIV